MAGGWQWLGSAIEWTCWLGFAFKWVAGCILWSGGSTSGAVQSPLVGQDGRLCSLARWYHWLDSVIGWDSRLRSTISPGWVRPQAVLSEGMMLLARLCVEVR